VLGIVLELEGLEALQIRVRVRVRVKLSMIQTLVYASLRLSWTTFCYEIYHLNRCTLIA
jgi:hypothetical protein